MPYVIGKNPTIRKGVYIPAGKKFEVSDEETSSFTERGFTLVEEAVAPNSGNHIITPDSESGGIPGNNPGEIPEGFEASEPSQKVLTGGAEVAAAPMGGSKVTAKATTKVSTKKE